MIRAFSPATAARAFLSFMYCTKAYPLCTEQPTILPYLAKMTSMSVFCTMAVLRLPMKTLELSERGSFLLVTLLVWSLPVILLQLPSWGTERRGGGVGKGRTLDVGMAHFQLILHPEKKYTQKV